MAEQEQLNIYQKLAKIRKQVEVIQKNKRGYGYTYVSEEEILAKITVFMDKYHLSLVPGIVGGTTKVEPYPYKKTKTTKGGEIYGAGQRRHDLDVGQQRQPGGEGSGGLDAGRPAVGCLPGFWVWSDVL